MAVPMIKINGKMVPAKKDRKGKWIPAEDSELHYDGDELSVVKKKSDEKK